MVSYFLDSMQQRMSRWIGGLMLVFVCLVGCQKAPVNDLIEGHWKLERFTTLQDGCVIECDRLYFSITYMVTEVAEKQGSQHLGAFVARTTIDEKVKSLILRDFKVRDESLDTGENATVNQLLPFGINNTVEMIFHIKESSHNYLILESDYSKLELRRF